MGIKLSEKAKQVIAAVAPTLGTALGGPFGALAGAVVAKALGGSEKEIEASIDRQDPEALVKLKDGERNFIIEMERLEITREQLVYDDRKDARARETSLGGDLTTKVLAYAIVGGFIALAFSLLFKVTIADSIIAGTIIGYFSAKCEQVVSYYFGSSHSSRTKTDALTEALRK
jgi:hypothetical protein